MDNWPLYFWSEEIPYGIFTNSSPYGFELDGKFWPTVEHYLQAAKFTDPERQEAIRSSNTVREAVEKGYGLGASPSASWGSRYPALMRRAVEAKVDAHADIRRLLRSTEDRELVHVEGRPLWDWVPIVDENRLGKLLMQVRSKLGRQSEDPPWVTDAPNSVQLRPKRAEWNRRLAEIGALWNNRRRLLHLLRQLLREGLRRKT